MSHVVSATNLNLRSEPKINLANRIATLPQGHPVDKLADGPEGWWKVKTTLNGAALVGFAAHQFLTEQGAGAPPPAAGISAVHLRENRPDVKRSGTSGRAFPLGESGAPHRDGTSPQERVQQLHEIVEYLDVEQNARYRAATGETYCNIYAYDFCYLAGVYLPRVWWTSRALTDLAAGRAVSVRYGDTVRELNANALYDWLEDFGTDFGWRRLVQVEDLQQAANVGAVAVICAQRKELNRSGHICVVVPERPPQTAKRTGASVHLPLQSQAGARNFCYSCGTSRWWAGAQFRGFSFWVHD
jgi:hypothetical protein